jgi:hypothetical protein
MLSNQLWIDIDSLSVKLGNNSYSFSEFVKKEKDIVDAFSNVYHNANKRILDKGEAYFEFVFDGNKLTFVKWPSYQSYLISGKNRPVDEIPFVTNVAKTSDALPYNFRGKYATLVNFTVGEKNDDFVDPKASQSATPPPPAPPVGPSPDSPSEVKETGTAMKVGSFMLNDGSTNTTEIGKQTVNFTATGEVDESGNLVTVKAILNL